MLNQSASFTQSAPAFPGTFPGNAVSRSAESAVMKSIVSATGPSDPPDEDETAEWDEESIVFLHWRLLKDIGDLCNPDTPLEEKLDTLRWIFTERDKESLPFSFVNCLKVVGCSPLSPMPYFGLVDAEEIRDAIRCQVKAWLITTLARYPIWVREAVLNHPGWVERQLASNPQWINEQVKKQTIQGDLFA